MISHIILSLLNRRGVWMTAVEIFDASPDYPEGDYVLTDLNTLDANGLVVARRREGSTLTEYGLPGWVNAPAPAPTLAYLAYIIRHFVHRILAA